MALIFAFIMYEAKVPREPSITWEILSNRTTLSAYVATFVHGITSISFICKYLARAKVQCELTIRSRLYARILPGMLRSRPHPFCPRHACFFCSDSTMRPYWWRRGTASEQVPTCQLRGVDAHRRWLRDVDAITSRFFNRRMDRVPDHRCHRNWYHSKSSICQRVAEHAPDRPIHSTRALCSPF